MTNITEQIVYRIEVVYIQFLVLDGDGKIFLDEIDQLQGKNGVNPTLGENIIVITNVNVRYMPGKKLF